jgi:hypothetical protein
VVAVSNGALVKVSLQDEGEARAKPIKCKRLFSDFQEKARKPKQLKGKFEELNLLKRKTNPFLLNG